MNALELIERARTVIAADEYRAWERRCDECLESLREKCRNKRLRTITGVISSAVARIARLEGVRNDLRRRFTGVGAGLGESREFSWIEIETAFKSRVLTGAVINVNYIEPKRFLEDAKDIVLARVRENLERHSCLKVNTVFNGEFIDANSTIAAKSIATRNHPLFALSDLEEWYDKNVIEKTLADLEEFQERNSGWALRRIFDITVNLNKFNPMRAGCWTEIPESIRAKGAIINVKSHDNACFAWAVNAGLYSPAHSAHRCSSYPHYSTRLNFDGIEFPVSLKQIAKFERQNDISINVFTVREKKERGDEREIVPLMVTGNKKNVHVNLLYVPDLRSNANHDGHFTLIKNLSRLVGSQLSKHKAAKYICDR